VDTKVKTVKYYIGAILVIVVAMIIFFSNSGENVPTGSDTPQMQGKMPNDSIHSKLGGSENPSAGNVNKEFMSQFNSAKEKAEKNPDDTAAVKAYADLLMMAHQPEKALTLYEGIVKKYPRRTDVLTEMTFIHYNLQRLDKAEAIIKDILKIEPKNRKALYNMGAVHASRKEFPQARELWNRVIKEFPGTQEAEFAAQNLTRIQ